MAATGACHVTLIEVAVLPVVCRLVGGLGTIERQIKLYYKPLRLVLKNVPTFCRCVSPSCSEHESVVGINTSPVNPNVNVCTNCSLYSGRVNVAVII